MSKEIWVEEYDKLYNEHCDTKSEDEIAKLADEAVADRIARATDDLFDRIQENED